MVDSGTTETVCGPTDFPDVPIQEGARMKLRTASGQELKHYGTKTVQLKTMQGEKMSITFTVVDVVRPLLSVSKVNALGTDAHFSKDARKCYLERATAKGPRRLGLLPKFGLFFLQVVVGSCFMQSPVEETCLHTHPWMCAPVAEEPSEMLVDGPSGRELVLKEPEVSVSDVPAPKEPSPEEREWHNLLHVPFAPWCDICVRARGHDDAHRTVQEKRPVPDVQVDYFFVKADPEESLATGLSAIDSVYGRTLAVECETKGPEDKFAVEGLKRYCRSLGFEKFKLRCDPEPSV